MHNWCTHLLTYHVLHMTHARYLLLTCLALLTWFWDFVYVLFRALCLFLWANLDLTKFVFLFFVFAFVSLLHVYSFRCIVVPLAVKNLWLTLHHHQYQKGPNIHPMPPTMRDSRLPLTLRLSPTFFKMFLQWWNGLYVLIPWDTLG